jgi:acetyltransferase-like isoleucine patch superfamily enzyme
MEWDRINPFYENLFSWSEKGEFTTGNDVTIYESTTVVGDVEIGDNSWIGPFCSLDGTGSLSIGEHCSISTATHILSHDTVRWTLTGGVADHEYDPVEIGDQCFVGVNSIILKGTTIGDNCLIAAHSRVSGEFPDNSIIAGNPAEVIGETIVDGEDVELIFSK